MVIKNSDNNNNNISFLSHKVFIHHWPADSPKWSDSVTKQIQLINKDKSKISISINKKIIKINNHSFGMINKVGLSVPMFQKQMTLIFEGHCNDFNAHIHITTKEDNYLEIFNKLISWRDKFYPDSVLLSG